MTTPNPDKPSQAWTDARPALELVAHLCEGTEAMRKASTKYLPQEEKESNTAYAARLNVATLFPAYRRTLDTFVAKPLQKQIQISEDTPEDVAAWLNDVDLTGRNIDVFARTVFRSAVNDGLTHILVDYPKAPKAVAGEETLADERAAKRRPYAVHITAANVIGWKNELKDGKQQLTQVRILESSEENDPADEFATITVTRVRVLEIGKMRLYKKDTAAWTLEDESTTTLPFIPLVTIYTNRTGFLLAKPPLLDLAYMNVAHWQSTSDQRTILHVARVPILHIATAASTDDVNNITIGASRAITTDKDTVIKFVEHTGAAIAAGQTDLDSLKDEMSNYGMEMLTNPGRITATERVIDQSQNDSALSVMARELRAGLQQMVRYMADWVKKPADANLGEIDLQTEFKFEVDSEEARMLWNMRINGDISQESFWFEMQRRGILSESFDPAEEETKLEEELPPAGDPTDIDPLTGLPRVVEDEDNPEEK